MVLGLIYGYIPFMILPLFGMLDRIDRSMIEAARDLGASQVRTFFRVTLPLSKQGILAGCIIVALPMFGDYFTQTLALQHAQHGDVRQPHRQFDPELAGEHGRRAGGRSWSCC